MTATVAVLQGLIAQVAALEQDLTKTFEQHPDAKILRRLPGLGAVLGARVLGEFGDDPTRYSHAKGRKAYAGTAPITRASGNREVVIARVARNRHLADACDQWAFCALTHSPGAHRYDDQHRQHGASHHQALRALANRLVGILHGCLRHPAPYNEAIAWPEPHQAKTAA